jgi:hypothetical protein
VNGSRWVVVVEVSKAKRVEKSLWEGGNGKLKLNHVDYMVYLLMYLIFGELREYALKVQLSSIFENLFGD